jgi:hypothetical protein
MRFTLTFDGELRASGNKPKPTDKWDIRRAIHPQLAELWQTNAVLAPFEKIGVWIPTSENYVRFEQHHNTPIAHSPQPDQTNLIAPVEINGTKFIPLIRESMSLICELDILFLRKEEPGNLITQAGDIDNRIKTLFDGLRMPELGEMAATDCSNLPQPFYCLLQSDTLVSEFNVRTGRLLTRPNSSITEVKLVIDVTVRAVHVRGYNLPLLGD